jgi:hypothetical protein
MGTSDEVRGQLHADPPRIPSSDPKHVKHVRCDGARYHVLSWSTKGTHCSEKDCIVNKDNRY